MGLLTYLRANFTALGVAMLLGTPLPCARICVAMPSNRYSVIARAIASPHLDRLQTPLNEIRAISPYCVLARFFIADQRQRVRMSTLIVSPKLARTNNAENSRSNTQCNFRNVADSRARATIIMLPGLGMPKKSMMPYANYFAQFGIRSVIVNLQGQGTSSGNTLGILTKDAQDLRVLLRTMRSQRLLSSRLGLLGLSYGAAAALDFAACATGIRLVVSVAPFARTSDGIRQFVEMFDPQLKPYVTGSGWPIILSRVSRITGVNLSASDPLNHVSSIHAFVLYIGGAKDPIGAPATLWELASRTQRHAINIESNANHIEVTSNWRYVTSISLPYVQKYLIN